MIVTPGMSKIPGLTVDEAGRMLDMADIIAEDETGLKVTSEYSRVMLCVDSLCYPSKTAYMTPDDAEILAELLIAHAKAAR